MSAVERCCDDDREKLFKILKILYGITRWAFLKTNLNFIISIPLLSISAPPSYLSERRETFHSISKSSWILVKYSFEASATSESRCRDLSVFLWILTKSVLCINWGIFSAQDKQKQSRALEKSLKILIGKNTFRPSLNIIVYFFHSLKFPPARLSGVKWSSERERTV